MRVSASSSPRRRRSTVRRRPIRRPRTCPHRPVSPYGITKLTCEHLARATARSFGLDVVVLRYFNAYGPRQRPDMAFTRIATCLAEGRPFDLFGDGHQSRSFTYVGDVVRGTIAAMENGATARTTSVAARRRRCSRRSRSSRSSPGRVLEVRESPGGARRPAPHEGRYVADSRPSSDGSRRRPSGMASAPSGSGPLLGSRRDERPRNARSRRRAGGRSPLCLDADHGALVVAGRRARDRRHARRARLGRRRRGLPCDDAALPRAALHDVGRRPDPEPGHEPEDRESDHPFGGRAAQARPPQRAASRSASCGATSRRGDRHGGPGQERLPARRDHGRRTDRGAGRGGGGFARGVGRRRSSRSTSIRRSSFWTEQIVASNTELEKLDARVSDRRQAAAGGPRGHDHLGRRRS